MKKNFLFLLAIAGLTLSSCDLHWPTEESETNEIGGDHNDDGGGSDEEQDLPKNGHFYGGLVEGAKYNGYEFSKSKKAIKKPTSGTGKINIFGINDFHGAIVESDNNIGLTKIGTIIKEESAKENTLFFDQGDTWQGSFESNIQYGSIIQDVYNYSGMTLRTVGNHDFDWGIDRLISTANKKYQDDYTPTLAANVYDYNFVEHKTGTTQQRNIGKDYATYILDNGIKVGVVGVIGQNQISSICTQLVENICFTDHISKIKEMSDFLKKDKACDVVVASVHGGYSECIEQGLTDTSPVSGKRYVDLVLNGHTHSERTWNENGVLFTQWDANGESIGKVELKYDFRTNQVLTSHITDVTSYNTGNVGSTYLTNDERIEEMVSTYLDSVKVTGEQVISSNMRGTFRSDEQLPNLMCEAIYNVACDKGYNVDYAVCNYARANFENSPTLTYSDLYKSFPFDNQIIIMEVSGIDAIRSITYNFKYHVAGMSTLNPNSICKIACIDYVAVHTDENRYYDNFPGATKLGILEKGNEAYTYRELLKDYMLENSDKMFDSSDYSSMGENFSVSYMY